MSEEKTTNEIIETENETTTEIIEDAPATDADTVNMTTPITMREPFIKINNPKFMDIKLPTIYGELHLVDITEGVFSKEPPTDSKLTKNRYSFYFESSSDKNTRGLITTIKDFMGLFNLTEIEDIDTVTKWLLGDSNLKLVFDDPTAESTHLGTIPFYIVQVRDESVPETYYEQGIAVANNFAKLCNICVNRYNDKYYLGRADEIANIIRSTTFIDDKGMLKRLNIKLYEKLMEAVKDRLFLN